MPFDHQPRRRGESTHQVRTNDEATLASSRKDSSRAGVPEDATGSSRARTSMPTLSAGDNRPPIDSSNRQSTSSSYKTQPLKRHPPVHADLEGMSRHHARTRHDKESVPSSEQEKPSSGPAISPDDPNHSWTGAGPSHRSGHSKSKIPEGRNTIDRPVGAARAHSDAPQNQAPIYESRPTPEQSRYQPQQAASMQQGSRSSSALPVQSHSRSPLPEPVNLHSSSPLPQTVDSTAYWEKETGPDKPEHFTAREDSFFAFGRVFKVLLEEPTGKARVTNDTLGRSHFITPTESENTLISAQTHRRFKIKTFVVIKRSDTSCTVLPISSNRGRGASDSRRKDQHAIIYSTRKPPGPIPPEKTGSVDTLRHIAIRVQLDETQALLDPTCRINYGTPINIPYDTQVKAFGFVDPDSRNDLSDEFDKAFNEAPQQMHSVHNTAAESRRSSQASQRRTSHPTTSGSGNSWRNILHMGDRSSPTVEPSPRHRSKETALRMDIAALKKHGLPTARDRIGKVQNIQDIHDGFLNERYSEENASWKGIASLVEEDQTLSPEAAIAIWDLAMHFRLD